MKELFIDGTKIEANSSRYTFVWRGSINCHLAGLPDIIYALYSEYNTLLSENGYDRKNEFGEARMFILLMQNKYQMSGNKISVRTLDLNLPFSDIANQLDEIVKAHFNL